MSKRTGALFTVGYGTNPATTPKAKREVGSLATPERLREIAVALDAKVIDVRAGPGPAEERDVLRTGNSARWASGKVCYVRRGFWRVDLAALLGDRYEWRGDRLGGYRGGGSEGPSPEGLQELAADVAGGERLLLMCSEATPGDCHRHWHIAMPLQELRPIPVLHIFDARESYEDAPAARVVQVIDAAQLERVRLGERAGYDFTRLEEHFVRKASAL